MRSLLAALLFIVLNACLLTARADAPATSAFEGRYEGVVSDMFLNSWSVDIRIARDGVITGAAESSFGLSGRVEGTIDETQAAMDLVVRYHYGQGAENDWAEMPFHFDNPYLSAGDLYVSDQIFTFVLTPR